jgi:hypothetical protein
MDISSGDFTLSELTAKKLTLSNSISKLDFSHIEL